MKKQASSLSMKSLQEKELMDVLTDDLLPLKINIVIDARDIGLKFMPSVSAKSGKTLLQSCVVLAWDNSYEEYDETVESKLPMMILRPTDE